MKEKQIEEYLRKCVKDIGGKAYKFVSPGNDGVPDRLVCLPNGRVIFVELKAPGEKPRPLQTKRIAELRAMQQTVVVLDSKEEVNKFIGYVSFAGVINHGV